MPTIDQLVEALKSFPDQVTYGDTMHALASHGEAAVPALIGLLGDPDHRWAAARILGDIGPPARAAIPALMEMAQGLDPGDRMHAAHALGLMGDAARAATAVLRVISADPHEAEFVREAAEVALARIAPEMQL